MPISFVRADGLCCTITSALKSLWLRTTQTAKVSNSSAHLSHSNPSWWYSCHLGFTGCWEEEESSGHCVGSSVCWPGICSHWSELVTCHYPAVGSMEIRKSTLSIMPTFLSPSRDPETRTTAGSANLGQPSGPRLHLPQPPGLCFPSSLCFQ